MKKTTYLLAALLGCNAVMAQEIKPYGALPSKAQVAWNDLEYYMFIHFGPNTFTNKEWGHGDEDPKVFNPTRLDARQWARTAKLAGMKGIVITAKHHDGFCLWPSKYSTHTVRESAWKDGKGDVLAELSAACKEYGLKFGVYLSPWDRNHPKYGTPEYNGIFAKTLEEVLTGYGPVFEQWFDGANDGTKKQTYDWPLFHGVVYKHQPDAVIFSDVGPGCRWVGNENGIAGTTNWSTLNVKGFAPGAGGPPAKSLNEGNEDGERWIPAECDVSIRPGWFFSPETNDKVKSVPNLLDIYYGSVGRNGNLILNVPVDREGLIHPNDSTRLMELRRVLDESFKTNLAKKAVVTVTDTRKNNTAVKVSNLTDGNNATYWATPDNVTSTAITLNYKTPVTFNRLVLQEYIALGQRVKGFTVEIMENGKVKEIARETTIGHKRILRLPDCTTNWVRIKLDAKACPVISEVQLYRATSETAASVSVKTHSDVAPTRWKVIRAGKPAGGAVAARAIDGNPATVYRSEAAAYPHELQVDLGESLVLKGFRYTPPTDQPNGIIYGYAFYVSQDGKNWGGPVATGQFANIRNNPIPQQVSFTPAQARYIRLVALTPAGEGDKQAAVAELEVITK
ncbi:MAG TPA: alpha-L-fucosidase [Chitinophaga sp.]|uniref:alpha-L-fucosidase n=1 Tax=Chitinophaga sp. TaxID=1869181 RepID=UPI002D0A3BDB|nr:alpha-L-fucosidase [Chitinophaga sp.]HVI45706.1 alpha-L-fucosidase [Chitinophaga sp.]